MHQNGFSGWAVPRPTVELTVLPRPSSWIKGISEGERKGEWKMGGGREERGKGRDGEVGRRKGRTPHSLSV